MGRNLSILLGRVGMIVSLVCALTAKPLLGTNDLKEAEANLRKSMVGYQVGEPSRYRDLFVPLRTEKAALSIDGKYLAYTVLLENDVWIRIVAVDQPTVIKTSALISEIERAPHDRSLESGYVDWLGWVTPTRLVISSLALSQTGNRIHGSLHQGVISAMDADGANARILATAHDFPEIVKGKVHNTSFIWTPGFNPDDPELITFVSNTTILNPTSRLLVSRTLNAVTGDVRKLSEVFVQFDALRLHDARGDVRLLVTGFGRAGNSSATIRYQQGKDTKSSESLDKATGLRGFAFSTSSTLGESLTPLGFDGAGDVLYYASNLDRDTHGIYSINLKTKHQRPVLENSSFDLLSPQLSTFDGTAYYGFSGVNVGPRHWMRWPVSPQLVMDRFSHKLAGVRYEGNIRTAVWLRPELQAVQDRLTVERPGRNAEILEWDGALNRFLVREQDPADAGSFYVLDLRRGTYTDFVRRGAEPEAGSIAQLTPFDFRLPDGSKIEGLVALPKDSKVKKIPFVLLCPDFPWQRRGASYQPEFEALTRMGFAVAIYNGRGAWGTGIKERQKLQGDYVGVQIADVVAVADHLAAKFPNVSAKAVALYGQGHGGHVALRALQLYPDRFRCAVTVDAWVQGNALLDAVVQSKELKGSYEKATRPTPTPLTEHPELIKSPVFTIVEFSQTPRFHANTALYRAVKRNAPESELFVQTDKLAERPDVLARQWARTESFLNYVLYNFSVKIGELEVLPDAAKEKQP